MIIVETLTRALVGLSQDPPKLTVFLYEIAEDPTSRNRPPVRSRTINGVPVS